MLPVYRNPSIRHTTVPPRRLWNRPSRGPRSGAGARIATRFLRRAFARGAARTASVFPALPPLPLVPPPEPPAPAVVAPPLPPATEPAEPPAPPVALPR